MASIFNSVTLFFSFSLFVLSVCSVCLYVSACLSLSATARPDNHFESRCRSGGDEKKEKVAQTLPRSAPTFRYSVHSLYTRSTSSHLHSGCSRGRYTLYIFLFRQYCIRLARHTHTAECLPLKATHRHPLPQPHPQPQF